MAGTRRRARGLGAIVGSIIAVISLVVGVAPASASDAGQIPEDIVAAFSESALDWARDDEGMPGVRTAAAFGDPHAVALWSAPYLDGEVTDEPVRPIDEWVAAILDADGQPLGTFRVWRPTADKPAEPAGFDEDGRLGAAFAGLPPTASVVEDGPTGSWFVIDGDTVAPLNDRAAALLPRGMSFRDAQPIIHAAHAERIASAQGIDDSPRTLTAFGAAAIVAVGLGGLVIAVLWIDRRRRSTR